MTPLLKNQAAIDFYAAGNSYKTTAREFKRSEHRIRDMIKRFKPQIMRSKAEQLKISAKAPNSSGYSFTLEDLGLVHIGPCTSCKIPLVGKTKTNRRPICGLCKAARAA